jgi:hypothetical protein
MLIDVKRFLALTTLIAAGSAGAAGCVIKSDDDKNSDAGAGASGGSGGTGGWSGSGGTGGSTGGTGGTGGYAGTGGSGGTAGTGGSGGTAGDAGAECFGDDTVSDAGFDGACHALPYASDNCNTEGGFESPLPRDACLQFHDTARPGVFEAYLRCVQQIPEANACDPGPFLDCEGQVFDETCRIPIAITITEGGWTQSQATCERMHNRCNALSVAECESHLSGLTGEGQTAFINCWNDSSTVAECHDEFLSCFFTGVIGN